MCYNGTVEKYFQAVRENVPLFVLTTIRKDGIIMAEFRESEHPRDKDGKFTDGANSGKISVEQALRMSVDELREKLKRRTSYEPIEDRVIYSGSKSGALDPDSTEAYEHAYLYYEEIRKRTDDIEKISENTGFSKEEIQKVKQYLFIDEHNLVKGVAHFDPDYDIAESWQRLCEGKAEQLDYVLIRHELYEMQLVEKGMDQDSAHNETQKYFDYQSMAKARKKDKIQDGSIKANKKKR